MASIKFTDSNSRKQANTAFNSLLNVIVVTFVYILLVHRVGVELGVDVNKPLRNYEKSTVFIELASMLLTLAIYMESL